MDCIHWAQLPQVHPIIAKSCAKIRGRFTGNPSHEFTVTEAGPAKNEERPELPPDVRCGAVVEKDSTALLHAELAVLLTHACAHSTHTTHNDAHNTHTYTHSL